MLSLVFEVSLVYPIFMYNYYTTDIRLRHFQLLWLSFSLPKITALVRQQLFSLVFVVSLVYPIVYIYQMVSNCSSTTKVHAKITAFVRQQLLGTQLGNQL